MRGRQEAQGGMFYAINLEERIRPDHPLRPIKAMADAELGRMSRLFDKLYARTGRSSVPPEVLLKAMLLQALYSIRSERQLVERIETDLLFRWFLGMDPAEGAFHATAFTHNRDRLAEHGVVQRFFEGTVKRAMREGLMSDDHFTVDGTLIRSAASMKSVRPIEAEDSKEEGGDDEGNGDGSRNPSIDFRGQRRSNATHRSTTDPEARLYRKGDGQAAQLCHSGHALSENRHGLIVAVAVDEANGRVEREQLLAMLDEVKDRHGAAPLTLGADKGYDEGTLLWALEERGIEPHVAIRSGAIDESSDGGWLRARVREESERKDHRLSQRKRKLIEEAFGWIKSVGGLRRTRLVGRWKLAMQMQVTAAAYNLVRMSRLLAT